DESISCPRGSVLRNENGTLNEISCNATTGNYSIAAGEIYCQPLVPELSTTVILAGLIVVAAIIVIGIGVG
ncbi:hypothetical protein PFISCL1PPCAC_869, partial [Pristionchus fissidentatus]